MVDAFSSDGRIFAVGGRDGSVTLWDAASHQEIATLTGHTGPIDAIAFSHDGHTLATASDDGTARLWDLNVDQVINRLCRSLTGSITPTLWAQLIPDLSFQPSCH